MRTAFDDLKNLINGKDVIRRSDIVDLDYNMATMDPYRRKLLLAGFLTQSSRGVYKKVKNIPDGYTTSQMLEDSKKEVDPIVKVIPDKKTLEQQQIEYNRIKKRIKKIRRTHQLYVRVQGGSIRRLDKISQNLYDLVMIEFLKGNGEKRYATQNKGVTDWKKLTPIKVTIKLEYEVEFRKLQRAVNSYQKVESIVVSYNGSWKPLVKIGLEKVEVSKKEDVKEKL